MKLDETKVVVKGGHSFKVTKRKHLFYGGSYYTVSYLRRGLLFDGDNIYMGSFETMPEVHKATSKGVPVIRTEVPPITVTGKTRIV